jgi:hypothetical protein
MSGRERLTGERLSNLEGRRLHRERFLKKMNHVVEIEWRTIESSVYPEKYRTFVAGRFVRKRSATTRPAIPRHFHVGDEQVDRAVPACRHLQRFVAVARIEHGCSDSAPGRGG